jgi:hypothetical protein
MIDQVRHPPLDDRPGQPLVRSSESIDRISPITAEQFVTAVA